MSSRRANGSKHPSVVEKIHGQPYLFTKNFSSQSFTSGIPFHCSGSPYLNGGQQSPLLPAFQMASSVVIPPPVFVGQPTEKWNNHILPQFVAGFLNIANMTAAAPIRRVNFLIQNQDEMIKSGRLLEPYKGKLNCFTRVIKNEGIISLWRGNGVHVIGYVYKKVLSRAFESHVESIRGYYKINKDGFWKWFAGVSLAEGLAGATYSFFTHPLYYAQTRLTNDIKPSRESKRQFNGLVDVCKKTLRSDGIAGIYRGYNVSVLEIILHTWAFIGITKATNEGLFLGLLGLQNDWVAEHLLFEGTVLAASLATYPMNTICRRMMMTCGEGVKYKSSLDAYSQILKREGFASLYKGVDAYILLHTVRFGLMVVTYCVLKWLASSKKDRSGGGDQSSSTMIDIKWKTSAG
ncbi:ADP,ATP carrier protein 3, mitochondrial-like [Tripterygium wilfordii]|nr:ADP,ATP carrier protein 3, mitochondrial-like [Tripterygium wilfordii]